MAQTFLSQIKIALFTFLMSLAIAYKYSHFIKQMLSCKD